MTNDETVEHMIRELRDHGWLCWHLGESTTGFWTASFCNYYEFMSRRGQPGAVLGYMDNSEISVTLRGDTLHEAVKNAMDEVLSPSQSEPDYDMDVMLGLKPEKSA